MTSRCTRTIARTLFAAALVSLPPLATAASLWTGLAPTTNNWSDSSNWFGGWPPVAGDIVSFVGASIRTSPNVNQDYSLASIVFQDGFGPGSSFTLNGSSSIRVSEGVINTSSAPQVVNAPLIFTGDGVLSNIDGHNGYLGINSVDTNGKTVTVEVSNNGINIGGSIFGSGKLVVDGPGYVTVSGSNSYSGGLELKRGFYNYGAGANLPTIASTISFKPYGGSTPTLRRFGNGTSSNPLSFASGEGRIAIADGVSVTHSGNFSGSGDFAKTETGTLTLTGNLDAFAGRVFVREGTLRISGQTLLPETPLDITIDATLQYDDGKADRIGALSGGGTLALGAGTGLAIGTDGAANGGGTFSGAITGSNNILVKTGGDTLNLTGANSYGGATAVYQGTLLANNTASNTSATGASSVTVNAGTIGGDGRISGTLDIQNGAVLAPSSAATPGTLLGSLDVGSLTLRYAATTNIELSAAGGYDSVNASGATIVDGNLALSLVNSPITAGAAREIIHANGALTGTFRTITGIAMASDKWLAVTYAAHGVFVSVARPGDATLDGKVDFQDLVRLAQNYADTATGRTWSIGDFTGDGITQFADLVVLAQNYGFGSVVDGDAGAFGANFAADWALAQSMAPEPTSLAAPGMLALAGRRRR